MGIGGKTMIEMLHYGFRWGCTCMLSPVCDVRGWVGGRDFQQTGNDFYLLARSRDVAVILVFSAAAHRFFHCFHT